MESATNLRDRKRDETSRALSRAARRRTAEDGLSGYTVDELCEEAGVSRRTFFNHFASKEDAVLGIRIQRGEEELEAAFLAGGRPHEPGISPTLVADLARLAQARWESLDVGPDSAPALIAAIEREPRLIGRMLETAMRGEAADIELVARREGLSADDLRAAAAVQIVDALARASAIRFLDGSPEPLSTLLERRIVAARDLLVSQTTTESSAPDPEGTLLR